MSDDSSDSYRISVLGASSSLCPPHDSNAALHLDTPNRSLLIDAGGNIPQLLKEHNRDFREITDILITHAHLDHTYGLPFLSHCFYSGGHEVRCWAPPEAIPVLEQSLEAYNLQESDRHLEIVFRELNPDEVYQEEICPDVETWVHPAEHSPQCVGITLARNGHSLSYSSDTAENGILEELPFTPEILLYDCQATDAYRRYYEEVHTSAQDLGEIAEKLGAEVLLPFHYNFEEFPLGWDEVAEEIRENFSGTLVAPTRGMAFYL